MSFVNIWIHAVWSTRNNQPLLSTALRNRLFKHLLETAAAIEIYIDSINGDPDHLHCLIAMNANQFVDQVVRQIKLESASWINQQQICPVRFEWDDGYYAVSVSESGIPETRKSIQDQDEFHKKKTHAEEMEELILRQALSRMRNFDLSPLSWAEKTFFQYAE